MGKGKLYWFAAGCWAVSAALSTVAAVQTSDDASVAAHIANALASALGAVLFGVIARKGVR